MTPIQNSAGQSYSRGFCDNQCGEYVKIAFVSCRIDSTTVLLPKAVFTAARFCIQGVIAKSKKLPKQQPGFKAELEAFEEKLSAVAAERKEEEATAKVRSILPTLLAA